MYFGRETMEMIESQHRFKSQAVTRKQARRFILIILILLSGIDLENPDILRVSQGIQNE